MQRHDTAGLPGSWRATPRGTGSGAGSNGGATMPKMSVAGAGAWTPTILNLLVLITLEIAGYVALRYAFRSAHGG